MRVDDWNFLDTVLALLRVPAQTDANAAFSLYRDCNVGSKIALCGRAPFMNPQAVLGQPDGPIMVFQV
jgi:hypothetical protein